MQTLALFNVDILVDAVLWCGEEKKERGRTLLVVEAGYLTGRRYVIPFIQARANNVPFQHENARSHVARVV